MASAGASLAHRNVSTIRSGEGGSGSLSGGGGGDMAGVPEALRGVAAPSTPKAGAGAGGPHTPLRATASAFASPSTLRAEEETIVLELGARQLRIGLAGDVVARAAVGFGPEQQRRVGDFRAWEGPKGGGGSTERKTERKTETGTGTERNTETDTDTPPPSWSAPYELWPLDVRVLDAGLVADKLERALRAAFAQVLMIDSRPRRVVAVLPPRLPLPQVAAVLDTLLGRFLAPSVSLLSAPVTAAVAAGLRSALVVDLGWAETVVTSVYEYREVACTRTVRAGRMLVGEVHGLLREDREAGEAAFAVCEDVTARLVWCRPATADAALPLPSFDIRPPDSGLLPTVAEMDDEATFSSARASPAASPPPPALARLAQSCTAHVPLPSSAGSPPRTRQLSFDQLAEPCERTFFGAGGQARDRNSPLDAPAARDKDSPLDAPAAWDDEELPVPLLIYRHLLHLPVDVRAVCMARLVFVGGCANVLGLRGRLVAEVARLVRLYGWDGVRKPSGTGGVGGRGRGRDRDRGRDGSSDTAGPARRPAPAVSPLPSRDSSASPDVWHDAANALPEVDPVEVELNKARARSDSTIRTGGLAATGSASEAPLSGAPAPPPPGQLRAVETLGAWSGASLLAQLRLPALAQIDREAWTLQGGVAGAVRPADIDVKTLQRQSMGPSGSLLLRGVGGAGAGAGGAAGVAGTYTLGNWGAV